MENIRPFSEIIDEVQFKLINTPSQSIDTPLRIYEDQDIQEPITDLETLADYSSVLHKDSVLLAAVLISHNVPTEIKPRFKFGRRGWLADAEIMLHANDLSNTYGTLHATVLSTEGILSAINPTAITPRVHLGEMGPHMRISKPDEFIRATRNSGVIDLDLRNRYTSFHVCREHLAKLAIRHNVQDIFFDKNFVSEKYL